MCLASRMQDGHGCAAAWQRGLGFAVPSNTFRCNDGRVCSEATLQNYFFTQKAAGRVLSVILTCSAVRAIPNIGVPFRFGQIAINGGACARPPDLVINLPENYRVIST